MGRHRHDRTGSVFHQGEVGCIDRHAAAGHGILTKRADKDAFFFVAFQGPAGPVGQGHLFDELGHRRLLFRTGRQRRHQGVLRGQHHEGGPEHRVLAGGKHRDHLVYSLDREPDLGAEAFPDPVFLHGDDFFRPPRQLFAVLEQVVGIIGNPEKPLLQLFLPHLPAASPAAAGLDLFVGKHGLTRAAPVDEGLFAVGHALFVHLEKEPLLPSVVLRPAGGDLPVPVVGKAHASKLGPHVVDVFVGPPGRVRVVGDGRVFGGHAEGVPAHRVEHVKPPEPLVAGHHISDGVVSHVAHVDLARRIGKHLQQVVFFPARVFFDLEQVLLLPDGLPPGLDCFRIVAFVHRFFVPLRCAFYG